LFLILVSVHYNNPDCESSLILQLGMLYFNALTNVLLVFQSYPDGLGFLPCDIL